MYAESPVADQPVLQTVLDHIFPWSTTLQVTDLVVDATQITGRLVAIQSTAVCPRCIQPSAAVHSRYTRQAADLPWAGYRLRLVVQSRKFFCRTVACPQRIFTERFPAFILPYARRTNRLGDDQRYAALIQSAEGAARFAHRQGQPVSPRTLLRLVRRYPAQLPPPPRILGVDDFAFRKGRTYGTVLVDLERHQPIDLLPDRTAATLEAWLKAHPGIAIITRDRASDYADGARKGAPEAVQVADRFHILVNVRELVQRVLDSQQAALRQAVTPPSAPEDTGAPSTPDPPPAQPGAGTPVGVLVPPATPERERRYACYVAVRALRDQGWSIRTIADHLQISRQSVRIYRTADAFPERTTRRKVSSMLDPYLPVLESQLRQGDDNGTNLWRLIRDSHGYGGSRTLVAQWVSRHRHLLPPERQHPPAQRRRGNQPAWPIPVPPPRIMSSAKAAWYFIRSPEDLEADERAVLDRLCAAHAPLRRLHELVQQFIQMIKGRQVDRFKSWLTAATASAIGPVIRFVGGLRRDYDAVVAALSLPYSNGPVEGAVNRLKLIKRMGYGRAKFDLLRLRVLAS